MDLQIWFASPFALALVGWFIATRTQPAERERWTWAALGMCGGAVLMFLLVFFSQLVNDGPAPLAVGPPEQLRGSAAPIPLALTGDSTVEVVPPTRVRVDSSMVVGSLQLTFLGSVPGGAAFQLAPFEEVELMEARLWTFRDASDSAETAAKRIGVEIERGSYLPFAFRGRIYHLALLDVSLPLRGFAYPATSAFWRAHAVIRLSDVGEFPPCKMVRAGTTQEPSDRTVTNPPRGGTTGFTPGFRTRPSPGC